MAELEWMTVKVLCAALTLAVASCASGPPPCDSVCRQEMARERQQSPPQPRGNEPEPDIDADERRALERLEASRARLADARAAQAGAEADALERLNAARSRIGLPAITRWTLDPGGMAPDGALLLFGGKNHKTYLGCLCDSMEPESVMNSTSEFGPNGFRYESIWNRYSDFGSTYGDYSPCSRFAKAPPVVVSKEGQFFGYLTIDRFHDKAITEPKVLEWLHSVCDR